MDEKIRIFISSPGDVGQERVISTRVIDRLNGEFSRYFKIVPYLWEHEPLQAHAPFQDQIILSSDTDIVVIILWSRLGTRLPENVHREDGSFYISGTEYEFEIALNAYKEKGMPDLLVYRKQQEPNININDESLLLEKLDQKKALDSFVDKWFGSAAAGFKAAFHAFRSVDEFENLLEEHLRRLIRDKIPEVTLSIPMKRWYKEPFRGLESFDFECAPIFFGRTKAIGEVIQRLVKQAVENKPFVIVYGMSGCGKSSLVKAGVLPTLTQPGVIENVELWRWCVFRPGDSSENLFYGLVKAISCKSAIPALEEDMQNRISELSDLFKTDSTAGVKLIIAALEDIAEREKEKLGLISGLEIRLAIVIDQMEELFTFEKISQWTGLIL